MIEAITKILSRCGQNNAVLPPTEIFNEGWMLRLILDWFDQNRNMDHLLAFYPDARWYSEALLPSRFLPQTRGDPRAESFTHADGVVGHFSVASGVRSDAVLVPHAKQFIVTEAKLGSPLSSGTKNASDYDQAARNVACMAYMIGQAGLDPDTLERLAFYVIAPRAQIESGVFGQLVTRDSIESKVRQRVASYGDVHDDWLNRIFLPVLERIDLATLAWESILEAMPHSSETASIREFYALCLKFNPIRIRSQIGPV